MNKDLTFILFEKLLLPLIIGIVGWFVKDYLLSIYARRNEIVRKEWEWRLIEVWCPLYYWSGIVMLDGDKEGWNRHGLKELESILTKSVHLIPVQHYNNLIMLLQTLTGQNTTAPNVNQLKLTREYIYSQIKTFNYVLYRRSGWFETTTYTDFFVSIKYIIRFISQALKHIMVWLIVISIFGGIYTSFVNGYYWIVAFIFTCVLAPILYDWYRQIKLHQEVKQLTKQ
ncbi:MAG: hypothetical protein Q8Q33_08265 [Chlamydiota bacterium]|nr:hypothetical protein [Chlamydiota bacterium]